MDEALLYGICIFFTDTPWFFMACVPFWKDRRIKKRTLLSVILLAAVFRSVTSYIGMTYAAQSWGAISTFIYLAYSVVLIVFFCFSFRVSFIKILYTQLLLQALAAAVNYIGGSFVSIVFNEPTTSLYFRLCSTIAIVILMALTFPLIARFFVRVLREAFYELSDRNTLFLCIVPIFFYIANIVLVGILADVTDISITMRAMAHLLIVATGLVSYYVNIKMYLEAVHHTRLEKSLSEQNELLDPMNVMKNEFFANTSHEMKTPLTVISAAVQFADALLEAGGGNPEVQEAMRNAQSEAMRLARLVSSTLNLSSMQESKQRMRQLDFGEIVRHCAEAYRILVERNGNELVLSIESNLSTIFGNTDMLAQVVTNLIENANRHTTNGKIMLAVSAAQSGISLTVTDTGTGVLPELMPKVFDRGISGTGSAGYGLYLCKNIAGMHRGEIALESEPEKGTRVTLLLPVYEGQKEGEGQ